MVSDQDLYMSLDKAEKVIMDKSDDKQEVDQSNVGTDQNLPSASSTSNSLSSTWTSLSTQFPGSSSTSSRTVHPRQHEELSQKCLH